MASGNGASGTSPEPLKSAYEAALEKLESRGIAKPDDAALSASSRQAIAEARRKAEAKLAELEIMHRDALATRPSAERREVEAGYRNERRRIEERLERDLARLRDKE